MCKTEVEYKSKELEKIVNNYRNKNIVDNFSFNPKVNGNEEKKSIAESINTKYNFKINDDLHESEFNDIDFLD